MKIIVKRLERDGRKSQREKKPNIFFFLFIPVYLLYKVILSSGILTFLAATRTDSVSYYTMCQKYSLIITHAVVNLPKMQPVEVWAGVVYKMMLKICEIVRDLQLAHLAV